MVLADADVAGAAAAGAAAGIRSSEPEPPVGLSGAGAADRGVWKSKQLNVK